MSSIKRLFSRSKSNKVVPMPAKASISPVKEELSDAELANAVIHRIMTVSVLNNKYKNTIKRYENRIHSVMQTRRAAVNNAFVKQTTNYRQEMFPITVIHNKRFTAKITNKWSSIGLEIIQDAKSRIVKVFTSTRPIHASLGQNVHQSNF